MMVYSPSSLYAIDDDDEISRWSKVIKHGNRLFVHSLCVIPPPFGARIIDFSDVICGTSAASTLAFFDLYWNEKIQGRVFIRLYSDAPKAKKFMTMCSGEDGMTYKGTCMFSPSTVDSPMAGSINSSPQDEFDTNFIYLQYNNSQKYECKNELSPVSNLSDYSSQTLYQENSSNRPSITSIKKDLELNLLQASFDTESSTITTSLLPKKPENKARRVKLGSITSNSSAGLSPNTVMLKRRGTSKRSVREQDISLLNPALLCASPNELYFYFVMNGKSTERDIVIGEVAGGMTLLKSASLQYPISNVLIYDCGLAIRKWEKSN